MSTREHRPVNPETTEEHEFRGAKETAEDIQVTDLHAPIRREYDEPRDGFEPMPTWMVVAFGAILFWGGYYAATHSVDFQADTYDRPDAKPTRGMKRDVTLPNKPEEYVRLGKKLYTDVCQACHQADGAGKPGENIPPLKDSIWVVGKEASPARLSRILLHGLQGPIQVLETDPLGEDGKATTYGKAEMPNWSPQYKDYQIASVLSFIRQEWGHKDRFEGESWLIRTEMVSAAKKKVGSRTTKWTAQELRMIDRETQYTDLEGIEAVKPKGVK